MEHLSKPVASSSAESDKLIREARKWIGTPYRYGGMTRAGVDCSGLVMQLFLSVYDLKLPRSSAAQQEFCIGVSRKDLEPGDLVFFATTGRSNAVSHVGLFIGNDRMIHASGSRGVMESGLNEPYFKRTFHSGGRVIQVSDKHKKAKESEKPKSAAMEISLKDLVSETQLSPLDSLELIIEQQIDSIYVSNPEIFD